VHRVNKPVTFSAAALTALLLAAGPSLAQDPPDGPAAPATASTRIAADPVESTRVGFKFQGGRVRATADAAAGSAVTTLNGLRGDVTLQAGENLTLAVLGNTVMIAAPGLLPAVAHDGTLAGDGTAASPLEVAVPLSLEGSAPGWQQPILSVTNLGDGGAGILARGGGGAAGSHAGAGVVATGGTGSAHWGGRGVEGTGGNNVRGFGGIGVYARGGTLDGPFPTGLQGGSAVYGVGGDSLEAGYGGSGMTAIGGDGRGAGRRGGTGIWARPGWGSEGAEDGLAGYFSIGEVEMTGALSVTGTKNFKIDHPLDPENKYLFHAAVESSEVLNVYSGNVVVDAAGEAVVELPAWFEAVNTDLRYQLTAVGAPGPNFHVAEKVAGNRFKIAGGVPGTEVSWQVTGVRSDAVMRARPFAAEREKPEEERGFYLTPGVYGKPEEQSVEWVRYPEAMQQLRQEREQRQAARPPR
jgi:hypothetical protein